MKHTLLFFGFICALQACKKSDVNRATDPLEGKIKSSRHLTTQGDTTDAYFSYDSTGKLLAVEIHNFLSSTGQWLVLRDSLRYENNKVISQLSDSSHTIFLTDIFFLEPGTHLIDSIQSYQNGFLFMPYDHQHTSRDASQKITHIAGAANTQMVGWQDIFVVDSLVYDQEDVVSFKNHLSLFPLFENQSFQFTYDVSRSYMPNTDYLSFFNDYRLFNIFYIDEASLGLSFGKYHTHAISSVQYYKFWSPAYTGNTVYYHYDTFTPQRVTITFTTATPVPADQKELTFIDNTYY